ncbi:MAG: choice-of-anchor J domain-containing protein [Limnohabitans sp.]|nr:choice-of-anchor J domain-containing protein [Limnohabitans sp.]
MKSKLHFLLTLFFSVSVFAQVNSVSETFETVTENQLPVGWQKYSAISGYTAGAYTFSTWAYQGTKSLMINPAFGSGDVFIVLPQTINARGILSLYAKSINGNATLQLGSATSNTDMSTFTAIGSSYTITSTYSNVNLDLNLHTRNDEYVVIKTTHSSSVIKVCLDNITYNTTCKFDTPVSFVNPTDNSIDLTWLTDSGTSVDIQVAANNQLQSSGTLYNSTSNSGYTISGLTPSTHYDVYVRMNCNASFSSPWVKYDVKTACSALAIATINEGFESSSAGQTPQCWFNTESVLAQTFASAVRTGTKGVVLDGVSGATRYLVSPKLDANIDGTFTFYAKNITGTAPVNVVVGTIANPNDFSTFTAIQTITSIPNTWTQYSVNFSSNSTSDKYIAVKHLSTSATDRFAIDDVTYLPISLNSNYFETNNLRFDLYPNPSNDFINISLDSELKSVEIYSLQGQKVLSSNKKVISISDLSVGIYLIRVEDENGNIATQKLMKQ